MSTLLSDIKAFCAVQDMPPTQFGKLALNDKPFVGQLEAGRRVWPETEAKVRRFMADYASHPEGQAAHRGGIQNSHAA